MEILSSSPYMFFEWDSLLSLLICNVKPESIRMEDGEYRDEIRTIITYVNQHKPQNVIGNMQDMNFTISLETQEWLDANLFAAYTKNGTKKLALVLSKDLFAAVSIEQTMDDHTPSIFETQYFDDIDNAMLWIQDELVLND